MRIRKIIFLIPVVAGLLTSCLGAKRDLVYAAQEQKIDTYVTSQLAKDESYTVTYSGGATRLCTLEGTGDALTPGGTVSFYYAAYIFSGSAPTASYLLATNNETVAKQANLTLEESQLQLLTIDLDTCGFIQGLVDGLIGVQAGGEYEILFSGKYAYGSKSLGTIPANSALLYKVWIGGVSN